MYPVGLPAFYQFTLDHLSWSSLLLLSCIVCLCIALCDHFSDKTDAATAIPGPFILNLRPFFRTRFDFLNWGFKTTGQSLFQFRLLRNNVVVVSGEQGRKDFFNAKGLDLQEGFRVLSGALPFVQGVTSDLRQQRIASIYKRLANVQKSDRLTELIPEIAADCQVMVESWGKSGSVDPFDKIYEIVFQTTVRCLTCSEIANDPEVVARLRRLYDQVDRGTTPATVLFPWFPSPAMVMKLRATKNIYDIVVTAMNVRKQSGVTHNDSLQMLLDAGEEPNMIVGFIMGLLIAGARSTGTIASWLITFLASHPHWRQEALREVQGLIASHAADTSQAPRSASSLLSSLTLSALENHTPILDSLIRETLRVAQPHVAMRRNVGPDMYIAGKIIPTGSFAVYPFSDVHLNPDLYPDPRRFDPLRPAVKEDFGYVGWGGGRVNCLGTRLAKLEMKILAATVLLNHDFKLVDGAGAVPTAQPLPNWNDVLTCRPSNGAFFLKYERSQPQA
ncbi:cytochrome P450 [Auriscalpium vulgare]|uniref:Cytochrome P450 n=1 Tax=Auriscalpium vulgare TaxID=40419 RepID=A0ACB8S772_9AGAM|nr:cytochrome P450 [Auriscalpium vulgare]